MAQSTLIKRGQAQGCSNATISRRHVCLPHDGAWMAHLPPMLALLHCQGQKHVCFRLRHTRGAHRVGMSTAMLGHPGLPPDLGSWDHPNRRVHGMCAVSLWRSDRWMGSGGKQEVNKDWRTQIIYI